MPANMVVPLWVFVAVGVAAVAVAVVAVNLFSRRE